MPINAEDKAYDRIKSAICKRQIRQGSRLAEATLASRLKLSRTPVRSALRRLSYEGLVEFVPNRGAQVIRPTEEEIRQTFAVRTQLEKMAASLAASRIEPAQIEALKDLIEKERRIFGLTDMQQSQTDYYEVNDAFHLGIAGQSGNEVLRSHIENLLHKTTIHLILFDPYNQMELNPSPEEHEMIIICLANGDGPGAEEAMEQHLLSSLHGMDFSQAGFDDQLLL